MKENKLLVSYIIHRIYNENWRQDSFFWEQLKRSDDELTSSTYTDWDSYISRCSSGSQTTSEKTFHTHFAYEYFMDNVLASMVCAISQSEKKGFSSVSIVYGKGGGCVCCHSTFPKDKPLKCSFSFSSCSLARLQRCTVCSLCL